MLHFLHEHWGYIVLLMVVMSLLLGIAVGAAFGCRTRRRRRFGIGKDFPPMSHYRPRSN